MRSTKPLPSIPRIIITAALIAVAILITHTVTANSVRAQEWEISDTRYQEQETAIQGLTVALQTMQEQQQELLQTISELQSQVEKLQFKTNPDIPLSPDLQSYTYWSCIHAGVDYELFLKLISHESGFQIDAIGYNSNGTTDHGLCQINTINHGWLLRDYGLDVNIPKQNIQAGILILSMWQEEYPDELQALACYAAGETGMLRGEGYGRAREILAINL